MSGSLFPTYTRSERIADAAIHLLGVPLGLISAIWLVIAGWDGGRTTTASAIYGLGLVGMLSASAAYNLASHGTLKHILRRIDHAMIFVMIAGTYTPFALLGLGGEMGGWLCGAIWTTAVLGVASKLLLPYGWERLSLVLYLAMGWAILTVIGPLSDALSTTAIVLVFIGGILYTIGTAFHSIKRLPFQNAFWHLLVLAAAACHFASIYYEFV
ncbi:DNA-binding protein [Rhodospirillum rubrum]|uniref:PAQR family membrane homeostasis protein TrhA n=1 Tax=Rhodospirillum rubrum TaxID=1085 RepID=UPI001904DBBF|nr:hemolysin III family protein [Rhodospirillum rubrum]MBK1665586.1 DNA-binding protein [Rhodospirillum rubrum]MBK1677698.1 DNA-binding protein [Rhodospirillum rubrum]